MGPSTRRRQFEDVVGGGDGFDVSDALGLNFSKAATAPEPMPVGQARHRCPGKPTGQGGSGRRQAAPVKDHGDAGADLLPDREIGGQHDVAGCSETGKGLTSGLGDKVGGPGKLFG